jgi:transglutaminase-like putative cysteine protease
MRPHHTSTQTLAAIAFLTASASFFTLLTWDGLSDNSTAYLVPLFWICVLVAALGLGLRRLRVPGVAVALLQVVAVALVVHYSWKVGGAFGGWLPTPASLQSVPPLMSGAVDATMEYRAPIPAKATAFPTLMLASGAAIVLLVDLFACTLRRVPLAGLPLLAAFTVPVSVLGGVSWLTFALAAVSFVLLLAADQAARLGTWGRTLTGSVTDSQPHSVGLGTVLPTATRIGAVGIGLAVVAPAVLPIGAGLFDGGPGTGSDGDDEVSISNPMLDVARNLTRGDDIPLLSLTTDDPNPAYLRFSVLDEFTGSAWIPSDRNIPPENDANGELPEAPGLAAETKRTEYDWSISFIDEFESEWLPVPYPPTSVSVGGDWRYDERTLDLFTPDEDFDSAGLSYQVTGADVQATSTALVSAPLATGSIFTDQTELPPDTPDYLEELAREVTKRARSNFERVVMLQEWFRSDEFTYTTTSAEGNGMEQLEVFLGDGPDSKRGYCEQFAAAMTLLTRSLGIPARIAVGFLRPEQQGDTWVYSAHDMHAWPEVYFEDTGWVRFEPTPETEAGAVEVPAYTTGRVPAPEELEVPSASPSAQNPDELATPTTPADQSSSTEDGGTSLGRWAGWAAVVLAVVGVLLLPRAIRSLLRRRRLSGDHPDGIVEGAWAELRATALDLGLGWDDGVTLRRRARALVPTMAPAGHGSGQPGTGMTPVEALQRLVLLLERSRFSRTGLPTEAEAEVPGLAATVTDAMRRAAKPRVQRRATWLPASLWRSGYTGPRRRGGPNVDRAGELDRVSL